MNFSGSHALSTLGLASPVLGRLLVLPVLVRRDVRPICAHRPFAGAQAEPCVALLAPAADDEVGAAASRAYADIGVPKISVDDPVRARFRW